MAPAYKENHEKTSSCYHESRVDPRDVDILQPILDTHNRGRGKGSKRPSAEVATELLSRFGGIRGVLQTPPEELQKVEGMTDAMSAALYFSGRACDRPYPDRGGDDISSSEAAYRALKPLLSGGQELFVALALNARNKLLREVVVGKGTLTSCPVHPREMFRALMREAAAACIVGHNHPSGDPEPSQDDLTLTRRLVRAGVLVGIPVLDHIIVGHGGYVSLASRGLMPD